MADFFGIDAMILDISTYVTETFKDVAEGLQKSFKGWNGSFEPVSAQFADRYIEGARNAFSYAHVSTLRPLRQAFVQFVADTKYLVLRDDGFSRGLQKVPELAAAILQSLFEDGSSFLNIARVSLPRSCSTCLVGSKVFRKTWLTGQIEGVCLDCQKE